jgi:hypothetical protein
MSKGESLSAEPFSEDVAEDDKGIRVNSTKKGLIIVGIAIVLILVAIGLTLFFILSSNPKSNNYINAKYRVDYPENTVKLFDESYLDSVESIKIDDKIETTKNEIQFDSKKEFTLEIRFKETLTKLNDFFYLARNLTEVDLSGLDSSNIKNSYNMFYRCINLKSVKFDKFDTSKLYNISKMFSECSSLESINFDLSNSNELVDVYGLFSGCTKLAKIELGNINTNKVLNMSRLFFGCSSSKEINTGIFNTYKVTDMSNMFFN